MAARDNQRPSEADWGPLGVTAARSGQFEDARNYLERAVKAEKRNPFHRFNLALACEKLGDVGEAIGQYSTAVRLKPDFHDAARRLALLFSRYQLEDWSTLDPFGLKAAMSAPIADAQPLAEAVLTRAKQPGGQLADILGEVQANGAEAVARRLLVKRTADVLKDDLLLTAIERGINTDAEIEPLLTALRRVLLLELPAERFEDRSLQAFLMALVRQCHNNEHVWWASEAEEARLATLGPAGKLAGGEASPVHTQLWCLYHPVTTLAVGGAAGSLRPKALREMLQQRLEEEANEARIAAGLPRLGPIEDAISRDVAAHYERAPYPRWRSLTMPGPGSFRAALRRFVGEERIAFLDQPFAMLVAGCGTGRQAIQAATGYGPNARVTAIDLSANSLAYGARKAAELGITNLGFAQADILTLDTGGDAYQLIECVGVLHHMADPLAGWRRLLGCLAPDGLMQVGLYSAVSRADLALLRSEPGYPGPGCSDAELRAYRHRLFQRQPGEPAAAISISKDAYSTSEFRDLALNRHEVHFRLEEIARFLADNRLELAGFLLPGGVLARFRERFPESGYPGKLADWQVFEEENPRTFDGMYRFWCARSRA